MPRLTLSHFRQLHQQGERFATLTAYDATLARLFEQQGVELLLVGDSLGMVVQGEESTVAVSMEAMLYHTRMVVRSTETALVMADMPFMSYRHPQQALKNSGRLLAEGGAQLVKLELHAEQIDLVATLSRAGVPVCAHLGLLPQQVHQLGGYRVQGQNAEQAAALLDSAIACEQAGASMLLLECVSQQVSRAVSERLSIPVIGIGAGPACASQVLVCYDMLGLTPGRRPRFVKNYMEGASSIADAITRYVTEVKQGQFPAPEHCFA
ncbi:3-methyl-2-oxobutanoate hydroxymethyltransferase [Ectothiorhodospiraceae bacterium BW-2]|nr:3-methyl-2-oxobutanoate hydroxymethyltransferase [Ectothiorhodospiraceae bacterium BW-2]